MSSESPLFWSLVAELGRKPAQLTSIVWLTRPVVRPIVTVAPWPAPGAGTVTGPLAERAGPANAAGRGRARASSAAATSRAVLAGRRRLPGERIDTGSPLVVRG